MVGYLRRPASVSKSLGSLARISAATSSKISSFDFPPPDVVRAYNKERGNIHALHILGV